jgi:hypothetical protein
LKFHGAGQAVAQQIDLYPGPQLLYEPSTNQDAWLEIPFTVTNKQPLRLLLNLTKSYDFGRYQVFLNGVKLGDPVDLYSPKVINEEVHLLDFWPEAGAYKLRLVCEGRNPASTGYYCGLESVRLRERRPRVARYHHEEQNDWRTNTVLYR